MNLLNRLYVRIWLAVVLVVALLTLAAGWLWRMNAEQERQLRSGKLQFNLPAFFF